MQNTSNKRKQKFKNLSIWVAQSMMLKLGGSLLDRDCGWMLIGS